MDKAMYSTIERRRQRAAQIIEFALAALAKEMGLQRPKYVWNLGQGWDHAGPHRLDLVVEDSNTKAYFTEEALLAFHDQRAEPRRQLNLRRILSEL